MSIIAPLSPAISPKFGEVWGRRIKTTDPLTFQLYTALWAQKFKDQQLTVLAHQDYHNDTFTGVVIGTNEFKHQTRLKEKPFHKFDHFFYQQQRKYPTQFDELKPET